MSEFNKDSTAEAQEDEELAAMFDLKQKKKKKTKKTTEPETSSKDADSSSEAPASSGINF